MATRRRLIYSTAAPEDDVALQNFADAMRLISSYSTQEVLRMVADTDPRAARAWEAVASKSRRPRGRPEEASLQWLAQDLGEIYRQAFGRAPGRTLEGPFARFVRAFCQQAHRKVLAKNPVIRCSPAGAREISASC